MELKTISLKSLLVNELSSYLRRYSTIVRDHNPNSDGKSNTIADRNAALASVIEQLDASRADDPASQYPASLEAADARRDNAIVGLRAVAKGFTTHYVPETAAAAHEVLRAIERQGDIANAGNKQETEKIIALIAEAENTSLNAAINTLGLRDWFSELRDANQQFIALQSQRVEQQSTDSRPALTAIRLEAMERFRALQNIIAGFVIVHAEEGTYNGLAERLNVLTEEYAALVHSRRTRSKSDKKEKQV